MDPTNRNTALASAIAEELARCGLRHAVICPGSRSTPLALALLREPAIATTTVVDERSAGFVALGAAAAGGEPVAVVCTSGTAAANLHPAVAEASESAVPLIVLTCDRPPELRDVGAGQTIDQVKLYGSAARWFCELGTNEADDAGLLHVRSSACRAWATARGDARPGPVHINASWRDPLGPEPADGDVTARDPLALGGRGGLPLTDVHAPSATLPPDSVDAIAADLAERPRGLIVVGRSRDPALAGALARLAAAAGYPILAETTSGVRLGPHDRELVIAGYEAIARARPRSLDPELIVRFGELPTSKPLREWIGALPGCDQLVVDPGHGWREPTRRAGLIVRADPVGLASALAARLGGPASRDWADAWRRADSAAFEAITAAMPAEPLTEPAIHAALGAAYRDGDLVYVASSMPVRDQESFAAGSPAEVRIHCNRGANGIDGTISSAAGAAMATGRPTWIVLGDLALHHDSNGLAALGNLATPVRIVVIDNGGGGIFEFLPQADQVEREEFELAFGTPVDIDLPALAAAYGLDYVKVKRAEELAELPGAGHLLAHAITDRQANVVAHRVLWERAAGAIRSAV